MLMKLKKNIILAKDMNGIVFDSYVSTKMITLKQSIAMITILH